MAGPNPYQRLKGKFTLFAVVVGGVASPVFQDWFVKSVQFSDDPSEWVDTIVGLVLIAALLLLMTVVSEALFDILFRFEFIRKMILGKDWIEGMWIDEVAGAASEQLETVGVISICYGADGEVEIDGESLTGGKADYHFHSLKSTFSDKQLKFIYRVTGGQINGPESHGFACYTFAGVKPRASRYSGYFLDVERPSRTKVSARKLTNQQAKIVSGDDGDAIARLLGSLRVNRES